MGRAQAARALGDNNCAHCSVRASTPTARRHRRIAPLALPDHQASLRCGRRGRAALLPTRRALPPTAESLQLRCCFSALGATPLMRLRTRSRQQGVNERARRRLRATRINTNAACANGTTLPVTDLRVNRTPATAEAIVPHRWLEYRCFACSYLPARCRLKQLYQALPTAPQRGPVLAALVSSQKDETLYLIDTCS